MVYREQSISLSGLRFYAYHGAEPQEAVVGAWYTVDITLKADATAAILNDDLNGTVNYAQVTDVVKQQMQIRSALLEHVAGRIAGSILEGFPAVQSVTVTVCKVNPPVGTPCDFAGFTLTVDR